MDDLQGGHRTESRTRPTMWLVFRTGCNAGAFLSDYLIGDSSCARDLSAPTVREELRVKLE